MDGAAASFHIIIKIYSILLLLSNSSRIPFFLFVVFPVCGPASERQTNRKSSEKATGGSRPAMGGS